MSEQACGGSLATWPVTCFTTTTCPTSAVSSSHESTLRRRPTLASCRSGGHAIWWTVEAATETDALGLLPAYVAERTTATSVSEVQIP